MITNNPMQLKALIKKQAVEKNISAQIVMQNYMMERLLERISLSHYKNNFILKGGFLIAAIVGLDTRATMDLDTTIKGMDLTHESITAVFNLYLQNRSRRRCKVFSSAYGGYQGGRRLSGYTGQPFR